jgi:hypothetical protein
MKIIIIALFAFAFLSTAMLSVAQASSGTVSFNNDPKDLATVTVADYNGNKCTAGPADGCWQSSVTANPGDLVSVQIYFHNTGDATSTKTAVQMTPENSGASTSHTFNGAINGGTDTGGNVIVRGSATINTPDNESLAFVPGSVRFYPNQTTTGHSVPGETYLFSSTGVNLGDIAPGWAGQGVLVADFRVSGSNNNGGGNTNTCYINSFYADSNSIAQGQSTTLHWNTSGNGSVYISGLGSESTSGSASVNPYSSTNYNLTLSGNNCSSTAQSVYVTVNQQNQIVNNGSQPQAITTVASVLGSYSAVLNGIAVPNISYGTTNAWFQYGSSTGLGSTTNTQVVSANANDPYSTNISGLSAGRTYYYRAVVQNQNGTAYGSIVPFSTPATTTTVVPTRVIVENRTVTTTANTGITAKSQPSLFKLQVNSNYDHMCIGGNIDYTVNYQNISSQQLDNSILRITFPGELTYASSSQGDYDVTDRTLTINLGTVQAGEQGTVTVHAQVNNEAVAGKLSVITATIVYTNPITHAQENAIAYSLITISNDCPAVLGASVFGFAGFLPQTLLQWLLLILVILALIVLARALYKKKEEPVK